VDFTTVEIGGVTLFLLVLGIVEAAKKFGISGNGAFALSLILGVIFAALAQAINLGTIPASWLPIVEIIVVGLAGGLATTGLYDFAKRLSNGS
jgi:hypothetical protein